MLSYLNSIKFHDYVIIAFCGHGGFSLQHKQTQIEINSREKVLESELLGIGKRENLLLDCCRVLLDDIITDSMENFGLRKVATTIHKALNLEECRHYYDKRISECQYGTNVLYGCDINEKSGESAQRGGYYSSSLIKAAKNWEKKQSESLPRNKYSILTVSQVHSLAIPLVKRRKNDQNPQISQGEGRFPWAIASY